jgi:hypothetical protein
MTMVERPQEARLFAGITDAGGPLRTRATQEARLASVIE